MALFEIILRIIFRPAKVYYSFKNPIVWNECSRSCFQLKVIEVITAGRSRMWLGTSTGLGGSVSSVGSVGLSSTGSTLDDLLKGQICTRGLFSFFIRFDQLESRLFWSLFKQVETNAQVLITVGQ